jgi:MtN3 and saliva related transmembrane protein
MAEASKETFARIWPTVLLLSVILLDGCKELIPRDTSSLLIPSLRRSEIFGLVAGFGTTFAAVPDMIAMFRRRSSAGMNPRMAAIIGVFQILWIYYGLLILSRPVVVWHTIGVLINFLNVWAYRHIARKERAANQSVS